MLRNKPIVQRHELYTAEDFAVWHKLFDRQMRSLKQHASSYYLDALALIDFKSDAIPDFKKTNERMMRLTGWQLTVVPELVPQKDFFLFLSTKVFPATCWLRTLAELDYIEEPDMFHDVFGHAPLLVNTAYAAFMEGFGTLALKWIDNPRAIELLGRVYWFIIEFGMLYEDGQAKVFGAGIISSVEETKHSIDTSTTMYSFDIEKMLSTAYRTDAIQNKYFVISSFEQVCNALPEIDLLVSRHVKTVRNMQKAQ